MSNYISETQLDLDPDFKSFFQDFYATSDTPDAHEHYVKYFTKDATLIMASRKAEGSEGTSHHASQLGPHHANSASVFLTALTRMPRDLDPPQIPLGQSLFTVPQPN